MALLGQLLAGAPTHPALGPATAAGLQLWITEIEQVLRRVLAATPFGEFADPAGLARAVAASFVGIELYEGVDEAGGGGGAGRAGAAGGAGVRGGVPWGRSPSGPSGTTCGGGEAPAGPRKASMGASWPVTGVCRGPGTGAAPHSWPGCAAPGREVRDRKPRQGLTGI